MPQTVSYLPCWFGRMRQIFYHHHHHHCRSPRSTVNSKMCEEGLYSTLERVNEGNRLDRGRSNSNNSYHSQHTHTHHTSRVDDKKQQQVPNLQNKNKKRYWTSSSAAWIGGWHGVPIRSIYNTDRTTFVRASENPSNEQNHTGVPNTERDSEWERSNN